MPKCSYCNKIFSGPSGLHYHRVKHHGHSPKRRKKRPPATPVTPALEQSEDKNFLIIRKEGPLSLRILSSRTDDIRYASTLSDLEVELGVYDVVWQNEQSMSNMPKGYNDPLYEFAVQPCVLSQMPDGVHGESRSCGMSLV